MADLDWESMDEVNEMRRIREELRLVPQHLRDTKKRSTALFVSIEKKWSAGDLPTGAAALWEATRPMLLQVGNAMTAAADDWDAAFPPFADPDKV